MRVLIYSGELSPYRLSRYSALDHRGKHEIMVAEVPIEGHGFDGSAKKIYDVPIYQGPVPSDQWACEQIVAHRFDIALVHGYWYPEARHVIEAASRAKVPVIMDLENTIYDKERSWIKELLKRMWLRRHVPYVFVPGERAAEYATSLGFERSHILTGLFAVDVDFYWSRADEQRKDLLSLRARLGLPERYFLFCGWLNVAKNVLKLAEAYRCYKTQVDDPMHLVMLGKGEHGGIIKGMDIEGIMMPGFAQLDDLTAYYAAADCFVLPSTNDPWPLVLLEAVASSLPAIVSWKCGNSVELIRDGWNGWLCDPYSPDDIARCMVTAHYDTRIRETAATFGRNLALPYTAHAWAEKLDYHLSRIC